MQQAMSAWNSTTSLAAAGPDRTASPREQMITRQNRASSEGAARSALANRSQGAW